MLNQVSDDITANTWGRICDDGQSVYGLGAFGEDALRGILHYVLHPTTGSLKHVCYMQDLFVDKNFRRKGISRRLLHKLSDHGKLEDWERIYWIAAHDNESAQELYKSIGFKLDFSFHVLPVQNVLK